MELGVISIVVLSVVMLVFYVVQRSKPGRFRLSATLLKFISINIEVDAQGESAELPPSPEPTELPPGDAAGRRS